MNACLIDFHSVIYKEEGRKEGRFRVGCILFIAGQAAADSNALLDAEMFLNDLYTALMDMGHENTPCTDESPIEFYKAFWSVVETMCQRIFLQFVYL